MVINSTQLSPPLPSTFLELCFSRCLVLLSWQIYALSDTMEAYESGELAKLLGITEDDDDDAELWASISPDDFACIYFFFLLLGQGRYAVP